MQVTVDIPDTIAQQLDQTQGGLAQRLVELLVADAYRCGTISTAEVGKLLNLPTRLETHAFLKRMGVFLNYDEGELAQDLETLKHLKSR